MKFHQVDHWLTPRKNGISKIEARVREEPPIRVIGKAAAGNGDAAKLPRAGLLLNASKQESLPEGKLSTGPGTPRATVAPA